MTDLEPTQPAELVLPHTGEVIDLAEPRQVAYAIDSVRTYIQQLHDLRANLETHLQAEFERQGTKTLHFDTFTAVLTGGSKTDYDALELTEALRAAGLPEPRIAEAVVETVSYRVNQRELARIAAANPAYAHAISANSRTELAPWRVTIKR